MKSVQVLINSITYQHLIVDVQEIFDVGLRVYQSFIRESSNGMMDTKIEQMERQVCQQFSELQSVMMQNYNNQQQQLKQSEQKNQELMDQLCKFSKVSQKRGELGESQIQSIIEAGFPNYSINRVSTISHSGDFELNCEDDRILFEIKNYTQPIPTAEIDKFKRDIQKSTCDGFIFVAINSRISNKPLFQLENYNGKPIAYISEFAIDNQHQLMSIILLVRDMINEFKQKTQKQDIKCKQILQQQKQSLVKILNSLEKEITKIKKEIITCDDKLLSIQ